MRYMLILFTALLILGCTYPTKQGTPTPVPGGAPGPIGGNLGIKQDIAISGFAFSPATITIPKGATVIWTNNDAAAHTVVSDSGSEISSPSIAKGETYAHTFSTPGTYTYHCSVHPSMKGTIIVQDTNAPAGSA
jgi:plastocyanin